MLLAMHETKARVCVCVDNERIVKRADVNRCKGKERLLMFGVVARRKEKDDVEASRPLLVHDRRRERSKGTAAGHQTNWHG